ncbi:hypothetical protein AB1L30_02235 [Bremerella sp. JC817]|uniref:hypothetical protein n=1 Tax=Bremerella sp. JC817 TaxID=3231756 RepID=UPI003458F4BA
MKITQLAQPFLVRGIDAVVFVSLGLSGYWELIGLAIIWGAVVALAIRGGIENAPAANWQRSPTRKSQVSTGLVLLGLAMSPCIVFAIGWGIFPALACCWLVWFGMGLMMTILRHLRGPIVIPPQETWSAAAAVRET